MEEQVVQELRNHKLTIATAESCTGGMIAARLVNVAGISQNFWGGFVTYDNNAKIKLLGVSKELLESVGAVSEEVAYEMAVGARAAAASDVSIVSTGIAGPDGGTKDKPVGLVYLGCAVKERITVIKCQFQGKRQMVREAATERAMELILECIKDL